MFPFQKKLLGHVLGPIKNKANEMAQAVLTITGKVAPRRTIQKLMVSEWNSETEKMKRKKFDEAINKIHGDSITVPVDQSPTNLELKDLILEPDDPSTGDEPIEPLPEDPLDADGKSIFEKPINDYLIHAEVLLPKGEEVSKQRLRVDPRALMASMLAHLTITHC